MPAADELAPESAHLPLLKSGSGVNSAPREVARAWLPRRAVRERRWRHALPSNGRGHVTNADDPSQNACDVKVVDEDVGYVFGGVQQFR